MKTKIPENVINFIARAPTPFHAVKQFRETLETAGFVQQSVGKEDMDAKAAKQFFFTQNDSSIIAVSINAAVETGFHLVGAHTDSPCLKVKPNASYNSLGCQQLGVEVYGGALLTPWFDRDLSIAGRLTLADKAGNLHNRLIDFKRPIAIIPSLAIHLNRGVNDKNSINKQTDLPPILSLGEEEVDFDALLLKQLKKEYPKQTFESVLAYELSLYDTQAPALVGIDSSFIASARLDNLLSCSIAMQAMLAQKQKRNCIVVLNDHEEVGSGSASGASGPFLEAVLRQICDDEVSYRASIANSLFISADNAHAVHPNFSDRHEPRHQPKMNQGPVIKVNHNQRYATNSETHGAFAQLCRKADIPYQQYVVRSDMGCGSTVGPIVATELGMPTIDIGVPQLAMHSIRELVGAEDCVYLFEALSAFFNQA